LSDKQHPDDGRKSPVYEANRKEWSERYGRYRAEARMWRWVSLGLVITTGIAVTDAVWQSTQSHVVPYVLQVDKLGESITVQRLEASSAFDPSRIKPQLAKWVYDVRTVYKDLNALTPLYTEAYAWVDQSSEAKNQLDAYYVANRPNVRAAKETVSTTVESVMPQGGDIWIVDWYEDSAQGDKGTFRTYWRMNVRIMASPPKSEAEMMANAGGFYIEWFHITQRAHS
jgi:type IV secretory pathway TrbF-like protein